MDKGEFLKAIKKLEVAFPTPWKKDAEYLQERADRRATILEAVRDFPDDVVRKAFRALAHEGQAFPSVHDILDACRDLGEQRRPPRAG